VGDPGALSPFPNHIYRIHHYSSKGKGGCLVFDFIEFSFPKVMETIDNKKVAGKLDF